MGTFTAHLRQILRRLGRSPMFTVVTILTLAMGIGANTAIFSILSGVLLKPLPYPEPDRLVAVWQTAPGINITDLNCSPSNYYTFREESQTFQDIGMWNGGQESITGIAEPERAPSLFVTDGLLPLLGVQPVIGRLFSKEDDRFGSPETMMLSYGYWKSKFGADASVLGRSISVNGVSRQVIGVLPASFRFMNEHPSIILPFHFNRAELQVGNFSYQAVARLKPGVTLAQANADVARMFPIVLRKFKMPQGLSLEMVQSARIAPNLRPLKNDLVGDVGSVLWVLMATVGVVLLIACANVANLLLVRVEGRHQELAVRAALGADRWQIARDLLLESMVLGVSGGALGLLVAAGALRLLVTLGPSNLPRIDDISIDGLVLLFTIVISLAASLLFGMIPMLRHGGWNLEAALRSGGRGKTEGRERRRARGTLVVVQVALALVLLISSGLMIRTLSAMRQVQPGFTDPQNILTLRVFIPESQVKDPEAVVRMHQAIRDKLAALPGVSSVGISDSISMDGSQSNDPIFTEDHPVAQGKLPPVRRYKHISPGYFATMGNPLVAGRDLTWDDLYGKRLVVLVSENLAREYWRSPEAAIGRRVRETHSSPWREVVGVVGDHRDDGVNKPATPTVYWPILMKGRWGEEVDVRRAVAYAIRSDRAGASTFLAEVRQAVWSVNPSLPLANVRTVQEIYNRSMARTSFTLVMLSIAAALALFLGVIGIYGVISYSVSQRTREIGIRMALGAPQGLVRGMFVREGLLMAGVGVACGIMAAIPLSKLLASLLFQVNPVDPITYGSVSGILLGSALLATYLPARRATRVEPVNALRAE